ncbi:hypothetical protein DQ392_30355 [Streptomyces reniochalinae]|uniref:Uncharacterized protein n=2 Tax=Streptomyces reniochalinae TaxID=2250578 RepID=A0A367E9B1_9ACTN|nr:hypothetical protein DQ392_30355 [Streptomyces reniochalinae]
MAVAGMALTTATGCMTVSGDPGAPGGSSASHHSPTSGHRDVSPRVARSPAKEALSHNEHQEKASGRRGTAGARGDTAPRSGEGAQGRDSSTAHSPGRPAPGPAPLPGAGSPGRGGGGRAQAGAAGRDADSGVHERHGHGHGKGQGHARPGSGVCELGEAYGRWETDSAQARICRDTYGR